MLLLIETFATGTSAAEFEKQKQSGIQSSAFMCILAYLLLF